MVQKIQGGQSDFSGGEINVDFKRNDADPLRKSGCRQLLNWRILSSKSVQNRSGRIAKFLEPGRVEEVLISPGNVFYLAFGNGYLRVYNAAGALVFNTTTKGDSVTPIPWTAATARNVSWVAAPGAQLAVYIAYADGAPNNVPQILAWDGVSQTSSWTLSTFAETITGNNQKRTPFYRIAPQNITLLPSATTGSINLTFSAPVLAAGMVGTRIAWCGKQILITAVTDSEHGTGTVEEVLFAGQSFSNVSSANVANYFYIGDEVIGQLSGAKGIVIGFSGSGSPTLQVQLLTTTLFGATGAEVVVGPNGSLGMSSFTSQQVPFAVAIWDQEVMNAYQGYPTAVFFDQNRLGFCNFPSVPSGIAWSGIGLLGDFYAEGEATAVITADDAIFELVPNKSQVLYVLPGAESSEFVLCDNGVYYIPITPADPLAPGSVSFNVISDDGCAANVQPRRMQDYVLFVNAGLTSVLAIVATGAYSRPYEVRNLTSSHSHLIKSPVAIGAPATASQFDERYVYILNSDGTVAVGFYAIENGQVKGNVGWVPFNGAGTVTWLSARSSHVLFTSSYTPNGIAAVGIVEQLDDTKYLDSGMFVNAAPAALAPPGGKGPLWYLAGGSVTLMDQGYRMMGTYLIDANGFIIPQNNGGENLAASTLIAGQPWTAILEPFVPDANSGADIGQRMFKRRVARFAAYAMNSTGFLMARLFSGPLTRTSPPLGAIMNTYRVTAWNQDDDATKPPPLREEVQRWRPIGRSFDPRVAIIKDTPGPILIAEVGMEATV